MKRILIIVAAFSTLAMLGCSETSSSSNANAIVTTNTTSPSPAARTATLTDSDRNFINEAAAGGLAEVELGRLAAQKAHSPDVKRFGERMVTDHSKANDELKALAVRKGITPPTEVTAAQKDEKESLSKLSGAEFDRKYMKLMVEDHDQDVKAFQDQANGAADPDLKSFAARTLPTLQEHQKMAKEINAKL
jgi:putative membrane protein